MHTITHVGSGESKEAALAQARAGLANILDEGLKQVSSIESVQMTAEGTWTATVTVGFMSLEDQKSLAARVLKDKRALEDEQEYERRKIAHDKDMEEKHAAIQRIHERVEEEWNEEHRKAMRMDLIEDIVIEPSATVMPFMAAKTYEDFYTVSHAAPEPLQVHMTPVPFDSLEYSVWRPTIEWMQDLLTADNDNVIRHRHEEDYKPEELMPIHRMPRGSVYTLELAA